MKQKIDEIKQKQERLAELLELYRKSVESESKLYHLFEDEEVNRQENYVDTFICNGGHTHNRYWLIPDYKYYLVNRETKQVICYGSKIALKRFMRIRKIEMNDVLIDVNDFKW